MPLVVAYSTVSYVTGRLLLFTQRSVRPTVDGASDPTEGRRLDRAPHRWCVVASNPGGRSDPRIGLRRPLVTAAATTTGLGGGRGRHPFDLHSDHREATEPRDGRAIA